MKTKMLLFFSKHAVYNSIQRISEVICSENGWVNAPFFLTLKNTKVIVDLQTNHVYYTPYKLSKDEMYIIRSPLISLGTWEALLRGVPAIILEEYFSRQNIKDLPVRLALGCFYKFPFISQTKKTQQFLDKLKIQNFLVPPAEKKHNGSNQRKHVLFVGKLIPTKNPLLFLKLAERFPDEKFILLGKGQMEQEMTEKAVSLRNFEILPSVETREELFKYYSEAKLLIHPAWKDPIGHVIIEALSTQTPVLASSKAGASDFLPKEWIAIPGNEQEWIEKTRAILQNQQNSVKKAEEVFEKEHLNIEDPYFEKVAEDLTETLKKKWPKLFQKY